MFEFFLVKDKFGLVLDDLDFLFGNFDLDFLVDNYDLEYEIDLEDDVYDGYDDFDENILDLI